MVGAGICLALAVFAPLIQITDTNDYNITNIDPVSGLSIYTPHNSIHELESCFENDSEINNIGFHGPDVPLEKGTDVFRIVIVGGSYVEGRQVSIRDLFSAKLEQMLNAAPSRYRYEVINLGFNGNGTLLTALYYKYYGRPLVPDLAIDLESQHELLYRLDAASLDASGRAILTVPAQSQGGFLRESLRHSKLLVGLYSRFLLFKSAVTGFLQRPLFFMAAPSAPAPLWNTASTEQERWDIKNPLIDAMAELVNADHAKLLFATFVAEGQPTTTEGELSAHFTQLAQKDRFAYDDLVPYVHAQEDKTGESASFTCDDHWSVAGHQFVAEALYRYLTGHPALISR